MNDSFALRALVAAVVVQFATVGVPARSAAAEAALTGDWSGTSLCVANHDPCKDEKALYHLTGPNERNVVTIVASKIVDGREIVMGPPSDFRYDPQKQTLVLESRYGIFRFTVSGDKLDGTLTEPSGVVYRKISLKRVAKEH